MVAALLVLAAAAAVVTLVLVGLAVARELRRTQTDQQQWRELAVGRTARAMVVGLPGGRWPSCSGCSPAFVAAAILGPGRRRAGRRRRVRRPARHSMRR